MFKKLCSLLLSLGLLLGSIVPSFSQVLYGTQVVTQNAVSATGNGTVVPVIGYVSVNVDITDAGVTSYTVINELLFVTAGTWRSTDCYSLPSGTTIVGGTGFSTLGGGSYRCNTNGAISFRTRVSAIVNNAQTITLRATPTASAAVQPLGAGGGGGGAPTDATYITQTTNASLSAEQALASLGTGAMLNTTTTGVVSIYGGVTCTNQFLSALSVSIAGTCITSTLTGAQFANQGTVTTVLHGNAAGNPSFGEVALTTDTSGNYVASVATTSPITGGAVGSEGAILTVACATCALTTTTLTIAGTATEIDSSAEAQDLSVNRAWTLSIPAILNLSTKVLSGGSPLVFEGLTADAFETTLVVTDPTAGRTFTLPNANSVAAQILTCGGTDKFSAISALGVFTCSADAGGGTALSAITAAVGANTIANGVNPQTWNWSGAAAYTGLTFGATNSNSSITATTVNALGVAGFDSTLLANGVHTI